jgi:hypothetical protein
MARQFGELGDPVAFVDVGIFEARRKRLLKEKSQMAKLTDYERFVKDMEKAGIEHRDEYHGRFYYVGPTVDCKDMDAVEDVIRATKVRLNRDQLGLGYIVYPRAVE